MSEDELEPCEGCGDGDKVPAKGYWICPKCGAEWSDDDNDHPPLPEPDPTP